MTAPHYNETNGAESTIGPLEALLEQQIPGDTPPSGSTAFLFVVSGCEPGRRYIFEHPEIIIGRSRFAQISISEHALSQQHCKLVRHSSHHRIIDLGSTNGTFVNDRQIEQADLQPGDLVRAGTTVFVYGSSTQAVAPRLVGLRSPADDLCKRDKPGEVTLSSTARGSAPADGPTGALYITLWLLDFVRRHWLYLTLLALLGGGLGVGSYRFFKPPARAEFELSLVPEASDNPLERTPRANFEFFRSASNNFLRPGLIHQTLQTLGTTDITEEDVRRARDSLEFEKTGQYTYRGSYSAPQAEDAIAFLQAHLNGYRDTEINKALSVLTGEVELLKARLSEADQQHSSLSQEFKLFAQEHLEARPEASEAIVKRAMELDVERERALGAVSRAKAELEVARKGLRSEDPKRLARQRESQPYAAYIADVDRREAQARAAGKGEEHPEVKAAQDERRRLIQQRDQILREGTTRVFESNPAYRTARMRRDEAEAALQVAQADLRRVNEQLAEIDTLVAAMPEVEATYTKLTRDQADAQQRRKEFASKLANSKLRLDLERLSVANRYDILTPPNVVPIQRQRILVLRGVMGVLLGILLGLGLAVLRELCRHVSSRIALYRS